MYYVVEVDRLVIVSVGVCIVLFDCVYSLLKCVYIILDHTANSGQYAYNY